jgi:hypothetical protein
MSLEAIRDQPCTLHTPRVPQIPHTGLKQTLAPKRPNLKTVNQLTAKHRTGAVSVLPRQTFEALPVLTLRGTSGTHHSYTNCMEQSPSTENNSSTLVDKFPAFYGTRRFTTLFTSAQNWAK